MKNPKFQIFKSPKNEEFYFRLRADNGEIILSSEGYTTKHNCLNGIASVKQNGRFNDKFERHDEPENYTFNLKAENGEVIGRSENYASKAAR